jgi:hypothetical protein
MNYYYAQINDTSKICGGVSQLSGPVDAPHMISITQEQYESASVMGQQYDATTEAWVVVPPAPAPDTWIVTRNAFQNRFPMTANGVSTKYDLMTLFLTDTGYAESLGVTGADLYSLRSIIITGNNRLGVVSSVDLKAQETIDYVNMTKTVAFPEVFRLTTAEANTLLTTPAAANETP